MNFRCNSDQCFIGKRDADVVMNKSRCCIDSPVLIGNNAFNRNGETIRYYYHVQKVIKIKLIYVGIQLTSLKLTLGKRYNSSILFTLSLLYIRTYSNLIQINILVVLIYLILFSLIAKYFNFIKWLI